MFIETKIKETIKEETRMFKVVYETKKYKIIRLYETETMKIDFVEDKQEREYDRIIIVKLGNQYMEPETITIYRYEDEHLVENMIKIYKEME